MPLKTKIIGSNLQKLSSKRMTMKNKDPFLEKRISKYDRWMSQNRIAYSSKVIPIGESLDAQQWVLPTEQVLNLFRNATAIALTQCECRSHYQRCDHPVDVCFLLNDEAKKGIQSGEASPVSLDQAAEILRVANDRGLVHLSLYMPDHQLYALCNCCSCCCHDLQIVSHYDKKDIVVQSDYIAVQDWEACTHCGFCIERCVFEARTWEDDRVSYDADRCYGCGLCITTCPENAIVMEQR